MDNLELFQLALGISDPWVITEVEFKDNDEGVERELHITIDFYRGSTFRATDGEAHKAYDTVKRTWRHLNFFQHRCYLHCSVPRIKTAEKKIEQVEVPWSRKGSGFTLFFEAYCVELVRQEMPVNKVGQMVGEYAQRIWTILKHYIDQSYKQVDHREIKEIGIDETSSKKGHKYITVAVDMKKRAVIRVEIGKDKASIERIATYLKSKGSPVEEVEEVSMDMSPSFIAGCLEQFPEAAITFDRFHVKKLLNVAMDQVRKLERKEHEQLKGYKYAFLRNPKSLTEAKRQEVEELIKLYPTLGEAYRLKILFDDFWDMEDAQRAEAFLENWCAQANKSKIFPFLKFVETLKVHWYGIISFITSRLTNGILEGINAKIQLAKRRARGYRNINNFISIIYLVAGNLKLGYPYKTT